MSHKTSSPFAIGLVFLAFAAIDTRTELLSQSLRRTPIVEAVEKTRPSIVTIRVPNPNRGNDLIGAGVIIDARGYIVTNRHVTAGNKTVKIRLHDGTDVVGAVIRTDPDFDLAVIRIKTGNKMAPLRIALTTELLVGETVIAIGHPFGYEGTVSRGIISALDREVTMPNDVVMTGLIQHDAPINPGNSGGPLVNLDAEVVGINLAMRDGAQNIAFAMNSDTIDEVLSRLLNASKVSGICHGLVCNAKLGKLGSRRPIITVTSVPERSPAADAGVKSGDIILRVGDHPIASRLDLEKAFWEKKSGDRVDLNVMREGQKKELILVVKATAKSTSRFMREADPYIDLYISEPCLGEKLTKDENDRPSLIISIINSVFPCY